MSSADASAKRAPLGEGERSADPREDGAAGGAASLRGVARDAPERGLRAGRPPPPDLAAWPPPSPDPPARLRAPPRPPAPPGPAGCPAPAPPPDAGAPRTAL